MYTMKFDEENNIVGKARNEAINASFKDLCQVCNNIRNMNVQKAIVFLEKASLGKEGKTPIFYKTHNKKLAHRKELNGRKGRYPVKAVKYVLSLLKDAIANAVRKGANEEMLFIAHACANKKAAYRRMQPKGRRMPRSYELARLEIVVMQKGAKPVKPKQELKEKKQELKEKQEPKQTEGRETSQSQESIKAESKEKEKQKESKQKESKDKKGKAREKKSREKEKGEGHEDIDK
ncbi:MAG: 50S ribosomal protein L22 [Candidatus Anstonellales archaeon]